MVSPRQGTAETLTELQLDLLSVFWERGELTIVEAHEALRGRRAVSQATVATLLGRLEKRGLVSRRLDGRAHVYQSAVAPETVAQLVTREFSERTRPLFQGNISQMVAHLLAAEEADPEDLRQAEELLSRAQSDRREQGE